MLFLLRYCTNLKVRLNFCFTQIESIMIQNKKVFGLVLLCMMASFSFGSSVCLQNSAVKAEDFSSGTKDECGAVYSRDGKCLLKVPQDLVEYKVKDGTEVIADAAFSGCKIEKIVLPKSLKSIRPYAFSEVFSLKSLVLPDGMEKIDSLACADFFSLESITIPNSVRTIGECAFKNCERLKSIRLPKGINRIERCTFDCCYELKSVFIPENLDFIAEDCFGNCYNLERIEVAPSNRKFCSADGVLYSKDKMTLIVFPGTNDGEKTAVIAEGTETIGAHAFDTFYSCFDFEPSRTVFIPKSLKDVRNIDFSLLVSVEVDDANPVFCSADGFLLSKDRKSLVACPAGKVAEGKLVVPDGIETIRSNAFDGLYFDVLELPSSISQIEGNVFIEVETPDGNELIKSILVPKGTLAKFQKMIPTKFHSLMKEK